MASIEKLVTDHLDVWTAPTKRKSAAGRGSSNKLELYGTKILRELILELAVRGLLVPQDQNDEPASELLKKIATEKSKLVKEGKIKKERALPPIGEDEKPFEVPSGWVWSRIAYIGYDFGQKTPSKNFTYIDVGAIDNRLGVIDAPTVLNAAEAPSRARKLVKRGSVIYATVRPYLLNIAIVQKDFDPEPIASTAFAVVHPFGGVFGNYIYHYLRSPSFVSYVDDVQIGIAYPAINDRQFFSGLIPVPPTAEQHRIVAKVDELMALCDQLEQQTEASISAHQMLVETLLNALTNAADYAQFTSAWQRIAEHFDTLFATEESIDQLKQTILQLAVMGKLVPQNDNEESVQKILERNDRRRCEVAESDRRSNEKAQPILSGEDRWLIPKGWRWRGLGDLVLFVDYRGKTPLKQKEGVRLLTAKNVRKGEIDILPEEFLSESDYSEWMTRGLPEVGDVLFTTEAPMGNAAVVNLKERFALAQRVICFQGYGAIEPNFLVLQILSQQFQTILEKNGTGMTAKGIKASKLKQLPIAIPPLAEQRRIVAKVDELFVLCDQLKSRLGEMQSTQFHIADAVVEHALTQ